MNVQDFMKVEVKGVEDADDGEDKSISAVKFVKHDKTSMTLQVEFTDNASISPDLLQPDIL